MLKADILRQEKESLQTAIVVLQNRIEEIDHVLRGGEPRVKPSERVSYPSELVVHRTDLSGGTGAPQTSGDVANRIEQLHKQHVDERAKLRENHHPKHSDAPAHLLKGGKDNWPETAEASGEDDAEHSLRQAEEEAELRGERFVAITKGVSTKRVLRLAKILSKEHWAHYNIQNGTKVYAVVKDSDSRVYLGKFSNLNARGLPLPNGRIQFLFKTPELQAQYTGL